MSSIRQVKRPRRVPATYRYGPAQTRPPAWTFKGRSRTRRPPCSGTTSSTCRYSSVARSTTVIRLPRLPPRSPGRSLAYQLATSSRRSTPATWAELVMPCGHHRCEAVSSSFQRKPRSTASPGTAARAARRLSAPRTPATPTAPPCCRARAAISSAWSSVRRRWTPSLLTRSTWTPLRRARSGEPPAVARGEPQPQVAVPLERDLGPATVVDRDLQVVVQQVDEVVGAVAPLEDERHDTGLRGEVVHGHQPPVVVGALVGQHVAVRLVEHLELRPAELG